MPDIMEDAIKKYMGKNIDRIAFYRLFNRRGQSTNHLIGEVKKAIEDHGLSTSEAKGFLDYMKLVIDSSSYLRRKE